VYKVVWMLTFRPELDPEEVRAAWRTTHADIALRVPGIRRYVQNHWVQAATGSERVYDGSVDCWFDDEASFEAALQSPEWATLMEDDVTLFDRRDTVTLVGGAVDEYVMRWDARPDGRPYTTAGTIPGEGG
jgi:uncharacterized protein (TIGR02118 family)